MQRKQHDLKKSIENIVLTVFPERTTKEYSVVNSGDFQIAKPVDYHDQKDVWYASSSVFNVVNVLDQPMYCSDPSFHNPNLQAFLVSLAVASGNLYRLILVDPQPVMKFGLDGKGVGWRLSQAIDGFISWYTATNNYDENNTILNCHFSPDSPHLISDNGEKIVVKNLMSIFVVSFFLNDIDFAPANFGFTRTDNVLTAVKIDPECCFNSQFLDDKDTVCHKFDSLLLGENHSAGFWESLSDNFGDQANELLDFLQLPSLHEEKINSLKIIAEMPIDDLVTILERDIQANNDNLIDLKRQIIAAMRLRHDCFKSAYQKIRGQPQKKIALKELLDSAQIEDAQLQDGSDTKDGDVNANIGEALALALANITGRKRAAEQILEKNAKKQKTVINSISSLNKPVQPVVVSSNNHSSFHNSYVSGLFKSGAILLDPSLLESSLKKNKMPNQWNSWDDI